MAPGDGLIVFFIREVPLTQEVDYQPYGPFPAETHEDALDKLTMLVQQLQEQLTRVVLEPLPGDPNVSLQLPAPVPLWLLGWDALGENITNFEQSTIAGGQITAALYDLIVNPPLIGGVFTVSAAFGNVFSLALTEPADLVTTDWPSAINFQAITILITATGGPWVLDFEPNVVGRDGLVGTLPDTSNLASGKTMTITMAKLPNGLIVCDTYATNAGV